MLARLPPRLLSRSLQTRALSANPDYLILGGGSAGSVLANRISSQSPSSTLLLDAGSGDTHVLSGIHGWKIAIPSALTYNLAPGAAANWHYETTPQKGMDGRVIDQPRGKVLGGSSCLNAMVYIRGHAMDYERWGDELKGESTNDEVEWSYGDCLPYFKKAQVSHTSRKSSEIDSYKGFDGPLQVTTGSDLSNNQSSPLFDAFVKAGTDAGYRATDDLNGFSQEGFGPMDQTVTTEGERCSTVKCYLRPAMDNNSNLEVRTDSMVTRILFDEVNKTKAIGAEYMNTKTNELTKVYANKEVICCLGAIGSPQLLQLSGIGDGEHLKSLGIETVVDNKEIGANLQDHLEFYVQYHCTKPVTLYPVGNWFPYPHKRIAVGIEWFLQGTGLASSNQFETGGFIRSKKGMPHPDLQYHFVPGAVVGQSEFLPHHAFQAHCGTMRPESRGSVKITSNNVLDYPDIDPNYLGTQSDIEDMRAGFRLTEEIIGQPAFDEYRGEPLHAGEVDINDDESVDNWIRQHSHSAYHPSCTVAMGTCVDTAGRVKGTTGLRVVDASIMPSMVSGNLNAPTIMVAEKIADHIVGNKQLPKDVGEKGWFMPEDVEGTQRCSKPKKDLVGGLGGDRW